MNAPDDLNNLTKDRKDALLGMYEENCAHARHHESQRATASNIIILTTAGLVGVMSNGRLTCDDWPLACALIVIGFCGAVFNFNHLERVCLYRRIADEYRNSLDALLFKGEEAAEGQTPKTLKGIQSKATKEHDRKFRKERVNKFRIFRILRWVANIEFVRIIWPLLIGLTGVVTIVYIFLSLRPCPGPNPAVPPTQQSHHSTIKGEKPQ
ncbi:MAG TPA: hypothetical protein VEY09_17020 [Pyrinomonadaceae bacterium]|nr:hypothetical protein [Pyrinomonadaceae bacterium]